jgi:hypothetical protein
LFENVCRNGLLIEILHVAKHLVQANGWIKEETFLDWVQFFVEQIHAPEIRNVLLFWTTTNPIHSLRL